MTDEWDTCDEQHVRFTPPTTYAIPVIPEENEEGEPCNDERQPLLSPTPANATTCNMALVGFYGLAGVLALAMVAAHPYPIRDPWEFHLLCANLAFWCLAPLTHTLKAYCIVHPLVLFSVGLGLSGHVWLWTHLGHEGARRFIFHYQKMAWVVCGHSIFIGLEAATSVLIQLGMVLSVASLSLLVVLSWTLHG